MRKNPFILQVRRSHLFFAVIGSVASIAAFAIPLLDKAVLPLAGGVIASLIGALITFAGAETVRLLRNRPTIFISYTHADAEFVAELVTDLRRMHTQPIVDRLEMRVGEDIRTAVDNMIDKADYFLFVASENSAKSDWAKKELEQALVRKKHVLPVVLNREGVPESLSGIFYADFSKEYEKGLAQLEKSIRR